MNSLSHKAFGDLLPREKQYKHFLGHGLYILVRPNGSKYWRLDYRFAGKRFTLSLGVFPKVTLDQALAMQDNFLLMLRSGVNPKDKFLNEKQAIKDQQSRQLRPSRFLIENNGILHIRLGNRAVCLTAAETRELRIFLESTIHVSSGEA